MKTFTKIKQSIRKTFTKIKQSIRFEINSLLNQHSFWKMKRKANKLHKLTGKRYHVVPATETTLMVVDNTYIKAYNKAIKGRGKKITFNDLIRMSYYSTPSRPLK